MPRCFLLTSVMFSSIWLHVLAVLNPSGQRMRVTLCAGRGSSPCEAEARIACWHVLNASAVSLAGLTLPDLCTVQGDGAE